MPIRWWPLGRQTPVVIDPARSFGQPIVSTGGVPTTALSDAVAAEGSVAKSRGCARFHRNRRKRPRG